MKNPIDIKAEIKWIQSESDKVRDPSLIELEEYNRELDEANARIESGKFTTRKIWKRGFSILIADSD